MTICLTGACTDLSANCGSNQYFTAICDELNKVDAGLVLSSSGFTFATTPNVDAKSVVAPLFTALDINKDNKVNALDGPIEMNILGFSWGGQNAGDLSRRIAADSRIDQSVLYHRVVVLDGFQPFASAIAMPATANEAWSFRHSKASSNDCSIGAPLGPYLGHRISCAAGQNCHDYDFSLAAMTDYFHGTASTGGISGPSVGHCDVPDAAHDFVIDLVTKGKVTTSLPPSVPVTP